MAICRASSASCCGCVLFGMLAVLFGMTFGAWRRLKRATRALPRHGRQRAGADRPSCRRQRRPDHRRRVRAQDRVQPHAQGGDMMAVIATLALLLAAIFAVCCVLLAAFVGSSALHGDPAPSPEGGGCAARRSCWRRRCRDADLPHVVVQIPSFNEGGVLGVASRRRPARLAARQAAHPGARRQHRRDRQLARTAWPRLEAQGFDIVAALADRSGFKGGALRGHAAAATASRSSTSTTCRARLPAHLHVAVLREVGGRRPTGRSCRRASTSSIRTRTR